MLVWLRFRICAQVLCTPYLAVERTRLSASCWSQVERDISYALLCHQPKEAPFLYVAYYFRYCSMDMNRLSKIGCIRNNPLAK
jgi:hypothetical protein